MGDRWLADTHGGLDQAAAAPPGTAALTVVVASAAGIA
jgi:hypothetical protein